jgi:PKHD-type hydroxylase
MGPLVAKGFLSGAQCSEYQRYFLESSPRRRTYQGLVNDDERLCYYVEGPAPCVPLLLNAISKVAEPGFRCRFRSELTSTPLIYRYPPGTGFLLHHDEVTEVEVSRSHENRQPVVGGDITVIVAISDPSDYEGGELVFPDYGLSIKLALGSVVIFPSHREYMHGVLPIKEGERFTMVARAQLEEGHE